MPHKIVSFAEICFREKAQEGSNTVNMSGLDTFRGNNVSVSAYNDFSLHYTCIVYTLEPYLIAKPVQLSQSESFLEPLGMEPFPFQHCFKPQPSVNS